MCVDINRVQLINTKVILSYTIHYGLYIQGMIKRPPLLGDEVQHHNNSGVMQRGQCGCVCFASKCEGEKCVCVFFTNHNTHTNHYHSFTWHLVIINVIPTFYTFLITITLTFSHKHSLVVELPLSQALELDYDKLV